MISYKKMWQEAEQKAEALQKEVTRLQMLVNFGPDDAIRELERTRRVIDLAGVARHLRVARYTPQQWRQRGHLPPVDFPDIKEPLWYASTIRDQFAVPSRRLWWDEPSDIVEGGEELSIPA